MAAIEERFQAAVNVIKGLPKNGPYQPSTSMMLKFYGLFKQASEGGCTQKKPAFWDVVGRAKWDAWNNNRHLSKEQAMQRYVESLQEIIETMSFTENVQNFVGSLDGLTNINLDELELVSPGMRELAESHPNSPFHSRTNSPQHGSSSNVGNVSDSTKSTEDGLTNGHTTPPTLTNGYATKSSNGYDDLHDTSITNNNNNYTANSSVAIVDPSDDEYDDPYDTMLPQELTQAITHNTDMLRQIQSTIASMNSDMAAVQQRVRGMEQSLLELRNAQKSMAKSSQGRRQTAPNWWPFKEISPLWFAVLVLWPFLVRRVARLVESKRR